MEVVADQSEIHEVRDRLAELLGLPVDELRVEQEVRLAHGRRVDAVIHALGSRFVIEIKRSASAASVLGAIEQLQRLTAGAEDGAIPLVVVPYMGEVGQSLCAEHGIAWLDLSGNALIVAPGLHIRVEGRPNRFRRRGRPRSAFAPKSSRIARWLLMNPERAMTQRELVYCHASSLPSAQAIWPSWTQMLCETDFGDATLVSCHRSILSMGGLALARMSAGFFTHTNGLPSSFQALRNR